MIQLHATHKLFDRLPLNDQGQFSVTAKSQWLHEQASLEHNPLSGWHGNLLTLQRRNTLLLVHDATRFPLVLPALTKADWFEINDRFADALMNTLVKCGAEEHHLDVVHKLLRPLQVDSICDRSVQGTLNRIKGDIESMLWHEQVNLAEITGYSVGAWLADSPSSVRGQGYLHPKKEMLQLLEVAGKAITPEVSLAIICH